MKDPTPVRHDFSGVCGVSPSEADLKIRGAHTSLSCQATSIDLGEVTHFYSVLGVYLLAFAVGIVANLIVSINLRRPVLNPA